MSNEKQSKDKQPLRPSTSPRPYQPPGKLYFFPAIIIYADFSTLATTNLKRTLYIKGYKVDREKIRDTFPREAHEPEETYEFAWYRPIINNIPESSYKYFGCGLEADGRYILVLVIEDGYDLSKMEIGVEHVKPPKTLPQEALKVLTFGIWPSCDQD